MRQKEIAVYNAWAGGKKKDTDQHKDAIKRFESEIAKMSQTLTVDIGLFGRMTTSDLVVNVEAACQVAHAISTHETMIESDYFTAMDDRKRDFAPSQTEQVRAAFLSSGTFFDAAVYYKYLNLDMDALQQHLSWEVNDAVKAARILVEAAALVNPTGKQNSFASHGIPALMLLEVSKKKRPISYANAFLRPVEGHDLMAESAKALRDYVQGEAAAFVPPDMKRVLLARGSASVDIKDASHVDTLDGKDGLLDSFEKMLVGSAA
ncbi:MAG: type I-E CRISPR-associated protein Cas7/Cse4/CasC [Chloroflexi bacterium]|nr:type I-E CRISPR-associated protein Cas7/Cse4/CasC [Chloroflexota bacterium]